MTSEEIEILMQGGIDARTAIDLMMGREKLYQKYLLRFLDNQNFENLQKAADCHDLESAFLAIHALKGSAALIGAMEIETPREDVVRALEAIQDTVSLYEPVFHDNGDTVFIMDQIRDTKNTDEQWMTDISLREAMSHLNPRERYILDRRFYDGRTQTEVADEIGISQAQVSRLEKNALKYMQKYVSV